MIELSKNILISHHLNMTLIKSKSIDSSYNAERSFLEYQTKSVNFIAMKKYLM